MKRARHPGRVAWRLLWVGGVLARAAAKYILQSVTPEGRERRARSVWLHETARAILPIFRLEPAVSGTIPTAGLLVCNHLSYLDIVLLAGVAPAVFVAKSEVARWPVFGWFARKGGTIFVQRERRAQTGEANDEIAEALAAGALVVLFPEGTSSGGERVLPFKSSLLEAAARTKRPIYAGLVRYELDDGDVAEEVCYWRDHVLGPHLLNLMSKKSVRGEVHFTRVRGASAERKELARQLHLEVSALRAEAGTGQSRRAGERNAVSR